MIGRSHSQLCSENTCSIKLQGGPLDPWKIHVENSWIIILQNNPKCMILNDKQMPHEKPFSLWYEIKNTKKTKTRELNERKFKKSKRNRVSCFNINIVVVLVFLSSTVEVGRC